MAMDEALFLHGGATPVLRFYTWRPAALSLGYFQKLADVPEHAQAEACVRRLTGGGAIHHADELTFSIAAPLDHPLYRGEVRDSYVRLHRALADAFRRVGTEAELRGSAELASDDARSGMCFHRSTPLDLAWRGRKGVGSAQRRRAGRVLHHGSIKLGGSELEPGVATLRARADGLTAPELAAAVEHAFAAAFDLVFTPDTETEREAAHAAERAGFFTSAAFVKRR